ncbi:PREDICTED: ankyrin repeat domain-containing protein SOWAHD [Condylura cristata]|uniref:ankyrin repeat domain-containing protein SOWAHD n=1 Tax=Condylura cristata TaxID=143302 RepID=UPI0003345EA4|nr:PREDICTED: ankyrin repeat domain-containing protein SOWAHD [Condylura cristata]
MAQVRRASKPAPKPSSQAPAAQSLRRFPQPRLSRGDTGSLGRQQGHVAAASSRESSFYGTLMLTGRRRGALRELLGLHGLQGLQGAAPAWWLSEERAEEQSLGGSSGAGSSRVCLEPWEHAWILATAEGDFEVLREQLEAEPELLLRGDPITGYTVLHWLAKHGRHEELIKVHDLALHRGLQLDVSVQGSGGLTPLHLAAMQGHDLVIKVLVGALGADPTRRDHSGHRASHYLRPNVPQELRDLLGAEDWDAASSYLRNNANNNSSGCGESARMLRRTQSAMGATAVDTRAEASARKGSTGKRGMQITGLLRYIFPFFQDR